MTVNYNKTNGTVSRVVKEDLDLVKGDFDNNDAKKHASTEGGGKPEW